MAPPILGAGQVRLRPATHRDFAFLRSLFEEPAVYEHWGGVPLADGEIREKYLGERSPHVECFVVEVNDLPVGLAQYHSIEHERGGGMDMVLLPEHRGQGVGSAVVQLVAAYVREELGWQRFTVDPDVRNTRAVQFWGQVGFQPVQLIEGVPGREPYWLMEWPVTDAPQLPMTTAALRGHRIVAATQTRQAVPVRSSRVIVRRLEPSDVDLVASIDRSEHVEVQYRFDSGRLVEAPVVMADIPAWDPEGSGEHSVARHVAFCASVLADGATLLGAYDGDDLMGLATVHPTFEPGLAWLATLHVSRAHRRRGAGTALWEAGIALALAAEASSLYVSATPTGSAVGFYLAHGCHLADPVHPRLFALEPDDIHLVRTLVA